MKTITALALFLFALPFGLHAQVLWQNITYGMPLEALLEADPQLRDMTAKEIALDYPKGIAAKQRELVKETKIFDQDFTVNVSSIAGKVFRVRLSIMKEFERGKADEIQDAVVDALREKYGPSASFRVDTSIARYPGLVHTWKPEPITVRAESRVMDQYLILSITYFVETKRESEQL